MSEQEALTIVLGALDQLTPRRTDPPTLMELTLCLGYSEAEMKPSQPSLPAVQTKLSRSSLKTLFACALRSSSPTTPHD